MKTTTILFALCFSSLLLTGFAQEEEAEADPTSILSFMDNDSNNSTNLPVKIVNGTTSQSINNYSGALNVTTNQTYAVTFTNGVPLSTMFEYESTETTSDTDYVIVALTVGSRLLEVEVDGETPTAGEDLGFGATFTSADECGAYSMNGATGVLSVFLNSGCAVTLNQTDAITGAVQYSSNTLNSTQLELVCAAVVKAANTSGTDCEITGTSSGSIIVYFALTVPAGTSATALTNIANNVNTAIAAKTLTVDGTTQLAGFAIPAAASAAAGTTAPSAAATAAIAAANKSHSRMVVVAGVFSTVLAAFFGLAF